MFGDGSLTFREFVMREPLPLATIHDAVLEFLRGRTDAVLFGAHAVNAYVDEPRMTQDVDILSPRAAELAEELRVYLSGKFQIAVRIRTVANGLGHRLYQVRKPQNRHLVDIRGVENLPAHQVVEEVLVVPPVDLIGQKVVGMVSRSGTAKRITDLADIHRLLLTFPELKAFEGPVADSLRAAGAPSTTLEAWRKIAAQEIVAEDDDEGY
ncbi:MAG: nucleotidyl transferase AbiEii/AbiGii toxin family protein [Isosphaeraceae bacterium]|jgi:nucleotidyltransferase AbiEii toxin of type IV toxin-antitoxin system